MARNVLFIITAVCWISIVLLDYFNKHYTHILEFTYFKHWTILGYVVLLFGFSWLMSRTSKPKFKRIKSIFFSPIGICLSFLLHFLVIGLSISRVSYGAFAIEDAVSFSISGGYYLSIMLFLLVSFGLWGQVLFRFFSIENSLGFSLQLATGIAWYTTLLFLISAIGVLKMPVLLVLCILPFLLNYRYSLELLKSLISAPHTSKMGLWGFYATTIVLFFFSINFISNLSPFPYGFDSRNFYVNISQLLADNGALIAGFQPYSWSLMMSTGFVLFKSPQVAQLLSMIGGLLAYVAFIDLLRAHSKWSMARISTVFLLFIVTPAVYNQLFIELKIDLGLLFIQIVCVNLFINTQKRRFEDSSKTVGRRMLWPIVLLALLCGFAITIKFTNVFLIFSFFIVYWFRELGKLGTLICATLILAVCLFAGIDEVSGMHIYHLSRDALKWALLAGGLIGLTYIFLIAKSDVIRTLRNSTVVGLMLLIPSLPWVAKNYNDSKSLSPRTLLLGVEPGAKVNLIQNYITK